MRVAKLAAGKLEDANNIRHAHLLPGGGNIRKRTAVVTGERPLEY
jgi:hypothetical protein